jgi:pimeloyl-ACP methyl ester carboxylesterase
MQWASMEAATAAVAPPAGIAALAERFDPEVMDLPSGQVRIRLAVEDGNAWDALVDERGLRLGPAAAAEPDALLTADKGAWKRIAGDVRGGMSAFRSRRLHVRKNLHLGIGFLAATSGVTGPGRLRFDSVRTRHGRFSTVEAGTGEEPIVALHGLGGTKASFLPTIAALADSYRVIALDLLGSGESDKPVAAPYDAPWFARTVVSFLDELGLERPHLIGNSMGGRVAIEVGLQEPERVASLSLLSPAVAWLRNRPWAPLVRVLRPELGLLQPTPRLVAEGIVRRLIPGAADDTWAAAGVDEFLRVYTTPRGRAAFYAALRNIYLDEPHGQNGFWTRLRELSPRALFVWGRQDGLVPISFMRHVEEALPAARHVELECGHVPQLEAPRETHAAIRAFLASERPRR